MCFGQGEYELRCEWGPKGLLAIEANADVVVIVDILSFSTAVDIAVSRGVSVLPYPWNDEGAARFASERSALVAGPRSEGGRYTLSPSSLRSIPPGTRLVLPSPNGSTLAMSAAAVPVYTACLRNAAAVARRAATCGPRVAVVPAGEQWRDSTLRPCLEDLIGAGAVLAELSGTRSPEAELATAAFVCFHNDLAGALFRCGSGKELVERGFSMDVELAAEHGVSQTAPVLRNGEFIDEGRAAESKLR
jgi:2-phosphosulfolactate phosphatase